MPNQFQPSSPGSHTTYAIPSNCFDHAFVFVFHLSRNDRGRKLAFSDDDGDDRSEQKKNWSINSIGACAELTL